MAAFQMIRALLLFFLLLSFSATAFAEYRTVEVESLRITIDSDWAQQGAPGYFPLRLDIANLAEAREIEIVISQEQYFNLYSRMAGRPGGPEVGRAKVGQRVPLKRGDRVKLTMTLPVFAESENFQIRISENGRLLNGFTGYASFRSARPIDEAPVLLAINQSTPLGTTALSWLRPVVPTGRARFYVPGPSVPSSLHVTSTPGSAPPMDFMLDPERLPSNWLGFTSLRAVLLGPMEWNQLSSAQKDALLTWTASGGDLLLVDAPLETVVPQGSISIANKGNDAVRSYYFGHIHLLKSEDITLTGLKDLIDAMKSVSFADWALPANRATDWNWMAERGFKLPIEGVGEVPSRAYLSILVLFVVLIGPLNYLYLWRKRMQVLLVFTVPLISAGFILFLTAYGALLEGFSVRSRAVTFTILDEVTKHAATRSSVSLYTGGLTRSAGVRFPSGVAVFPIGTDGYGPRGQRSLDLTGAQTFQTGLLQSRTPSNFEEVTFRAARERLSFERSGSELRVVNGLGSTIRQLVYREGGQMYTLAGELGAGEKATLKLESGKTGLFEGLLKLPPGPSARLRKVIEGQPEGSYLAVLETSPFWEPGVAKVVETESMHVVLGLRENL